MKNWFGFLLRATFLGLFMAILLLLLVPELRRDSSLSEAIFSQNSHPSKMSFYEAVSRAAPSVVNIYTTSKEYRNRLFRIDPVETTSLGSGVIMQENGYILTCLHVIENAQTIDVGLHDGTIVEAQLVGGDRITDLAVLKISANNLPVIPQYSDNQSRVGDVVLSIGNPYALGQTITQGIVSRIGRIGIENMMLYDFIQMDAVINQGSSGGALVDSNGYLVGINNSNFKTLDRNRRVKDVDGVFFAVPYQLAKRVMDEIIANGRARHGQLGFQGNQLPNLPGIYITEVNAGGPAAQAGIQAGDTLLAINGEQVNGVGDTLDKVTAFAPGTMIEVEIERNGERFTTGMTVADR